MLVPFLYMRSTTPAICQTKHNFTSISIDTNIFNNYAKSTLLYLMYYKFTKSHTWSLL